MKDEKIGKRKISLKIPIKNPTGFVGKDIGRIERKKKAPQKRG